jgi:hypothetical protein
MWAWRNFTVLKEKAYVTMALFFQNWKEEFLQYVYVTVTGNSVK